MLRRAWMNLVLIALVGFIVGCDGGPSPTSASAVATATPTRSPTAVPTPTPAAPTATSVPELPATLFGVSLSPKSYGQADFLQFLELALEAGPALRGGNQWLDLAVENQPASIVAQLAVQNGLVPVIETSFFVQESGELTTDVTDPAVREEMIRIAGEFAEKFQPPYFSLAVELNIIEETNPEAFDIFADEVFPAAAAAIREASPQTKVFVTFQLERLRGLRGGLFGGQNDPADTNWEFLSRFPDADLISFTTYPMLVYKDPSEIPDDYYSEILEHTDKPVAFTEIGWFGESEIPGWEATPDEQAEYVTKFLDLIEPLDAKLVMWSFLFDQVEAPAPFDTSGFFDADGEPRAAWDVWRAAAE